VMGNGGVGTFLEKVFANNVVCRMWGGAL
jgi:hypothetical protein